MARRKKFTVVLDTIHLLEYMSGKLDAAEVETDRGEILSEWSFIWQELKRQIKEVHWNDFDPSLPGKRWRNLFPGDGIAPLRTLAHRIRESGWEEFVVPEVRPDIIGYRTRRLLELRRKMDHYFG